MIEEDEEQDGARVAAMPKINTCTVPSKETYVVGMETSNKN